MENNRLGWIFQIFTLVLSTVAVGISVWSLFISSQANSISSQANNIQYQNADVSSILTIFALSKELQPELLKAFPEIYQNADSKKIAIGKGIALYSQIYLINSVHKLPRDFVAAFLAEARQFFLNPEVKARYDELKQYHLKSFADFVFCIQTASRECL